MQAIVTENLSKTYNGRGGCSDISLQVACGQVFGLLGPNGAGKSTLVKTLLGLARPTGGRGRVLGHALGAKAALAKTGYLPELFRYHDWLNGMELLRLHGQLQRMPAGHISRRIPEVLELVGLRGKEHQKIGTYSKGMQQRIGLAAALMPDPELLFLDEPTSALDPIGRREVRDLLKFLKDKGTTVFLNSHLLSEVETVCDTIGIINRGRLVVAGPFKELQAGPLNLTIKAQAAKPLPDRWRPEFVRRKEADGVLVLTGSAADNAAVSVLVNELIDHGMSIYEVRQDRQSLEDLFVYWVNRQDAPEGRGN